MKCLCGEEATRVYNSKGAKMCDWCFRGLRYFIFTGNQMTGPQLKELEEYFKNEKLPEREFHDSSKSD